MRKVFLLLAALVFASSSPAWAQKIGAPQCLVLKSLEAKFGTLNQGSDDQRREFALKVAEQFAFSFPGQGYGSKRASTGRPPTKDVVARQLNGVFEGWDLVNGTTRKVTCDGTRYDLTGQVFIPVTAHDWLESTQEPPPPPPPATDDVLTELKAIHALLDQVVANQNAQSAALVDAVNQLKAEVAKGIKVRFN